MCYTYNPPAKSNFEFTSRLFALLGSNKDNPDLVSFSIYLHEKGQFWPRSDITGVGQSDEIKLNKNVELEGSYSVTKFEVLNLKDYPCNEDNNFSLTKCLDDFVAKESGCSFNWFSNSSNCFTPAKLKINYQKLIWIKQTPWQTVVSQSGCLPKCKYIKYEFIPKKKTGVTWKKSWVSSFYLHPSSTQEKGSIQYLAYDEQNILGDVGGFLGLFLGWSTYSLLTEFPLWVSKMTCKLYNVVRPQKQFDVY